MQFGIMFFAKSILFGVGLAMDAFSVSLANGLHEPDMKKHKALGISGIFAFFQALMPMIGWICIKTVSKHFHSFQSFIPWIALILLSYIGGKMLYEGITNKCDEESGCALSFGALVIQGIATSIDALSVGLDIEEYTLFPALISSVIIAVVTFIICLSGVIIGKKVGMKLAGKAGIFGGIILVLIGLEIFITGIL